GVGVEAALAALDVLHGGVGHRTLPGSDGPDEAEALRTAQHLALHAQALLAVGIHEEPGRAVAVRRVDVRVPQVHRLEHVPIGVDDVVRATHGSSPFDLSEVRPAQSKRTPPSTLKDWPVI